ncbi:uncharacterized protein LOC134720658 isoform X2 [Mytilus trossulus]|uniref:uncharacterized protein LOC134720658 isoform X2 n=1 Tax=Mytilus trossulus TaxID=6551 RepID=UPI0030077E04
MSNILFTLLLVLSLGDFISSQDVSFATAGLVNYKLQKLKFSCSPSAQSLWNGITHITISQNSSSGFQDIVSVVFDFKTLKNVTIWKKTSWRNRATIIREYVAPVTTNTGLEFDIPAEQVQCSDEGTYRCKIIGSSTNNNQPIDIDKFGTVQLSVKPTAIDQMTVSPQQPEGIYTPYTLVQLMCTGEVGNPAQFLRWCYRRPTDQSFLGWYDNTNIDPGTEFLQDCMYRRTSTLRYNVSAADEYTEFRCETGGDSNVCNRPSSISTNVTIFRYTAPTRDPQGPGDTVDAGTIAGAIIGSFVGIILIVVIVYFVAFRKKNEGETYRTKEENGRTGSAPIDNTVYSVPNKEQRHGDRDRCDENLISQQPPPPPRPHKQELHYAELDIASNPPGIPPPKPLKPKPKPRTKKGEPPTEYAVVKFV